MIVRASLTCNEKQLFSFTFGDGNLQGEEKMNAIIEGVDQAKKEAMDLINGMLKQKQGGVGKSSRTSFYAFQT